MTVAVYEKAKQKNVKCYLFPGIFKIEHLRQLDAVIVISWLGKSCLQSRPLPAIIAHSPSHRSNSTPGSKTSLCSDPYAINRPALPSERHATVGAIASCDQRGAGRPLLSSGTELPPAKYLPPKLSLLVTHRCHVEDRPFAVFSLSPILISCQCAVS